MTDYELNELRRIERTPVQQLTEEDGAVYWRLRTKREHEVADADGAR